MINAGIGVTQMNTVMTTLNIPGIHHKSMKQREREVAQGIFKVSTQNKSVSIWKLPGTCYNDHCGLC